MADKLTLPEGVTVKELREWARQNGIEVGKRGRVSQDLIRRYIEATEE